MNFLENNPKELHIMVDIETLDIIPGAAITEIGAVIMNQLGRHTFDRAFHSHCIDPHGTVSQDTVTWRLERNLPWIHFDGMDREQVQSHPQYIKHVLNKFFDWIVASCATTDTTPVMWCKGIDFDKAIIEHAAKKRCDIQAMPWAYNKFFDMRTMLYVFPQFKVPKEHVKHNGLDDALLQASSLIKVAEHLFQLRYDWDFNRD